MDFDARPFREAATEFREIVDARRTTDVSVHLDSIGSILAKLYALACELPAIAGLDHYPQEGDLPWDDRRALLIDLGEFLEGYDLYWDVFDPTQHREADRSPVAGSLADDLTDIYSDLHKGEQLWCRGLEEEAVWYWRFSFWSHWGAHTVGALRAIHWWRSSDRQDDETS